MSPSPARSLSRSRKREFTRSPPPHLRRDRQRGDRATSSISRSRSHSRSPPPNRRRHRSFSRSDSGTPPRRGVSPRGGERQRLGGRRDSRSLSVERRRRSRSPLRREGSKDAPKSKRKMDVDEPPRDELKIKGQAEIGRNKVSKTHQGHTYL